MRSLRTYAWAQISLLPAGVWPALRVAVAGAVVFALIYIALDFNKLYALRYGADTGRFLQFLVSEAHRHGSTNRAEAQPHLQVHDSWMLLALVPLVAVFPFTQTLLVLQVLAIAAGAVALCVLALSFGASSRAAGIVSVAYVLSPSAQGIAYGNFLENVFVPLFAILAAIAARRRSFFGTLVFAQVLLGLKEDEALFLLWFGGACALWWDRRIGLAVCLLALLNGIAFAAYEHVTRGHPSIPSYSLHIDDPLSKISFFLALVAPFAFAPLCVGRRLLLALPLVAELTFNRPWAYAITRIGVHWTAPIFTLTAIGAAYVVAKRPRFATPVLIMAIVCALTINDTVLKIGRWPYIVDWRAYAAAVTLREHSHGVVLARHDEGVYAVAASNPRVALADWHARDTGFCPSYNTSGAAFLASIGIGTWPRDMRLCGGVAIGTLRTPPRCAKTRHPSQNDRTLRNTPRADALELCSR